MIMAKKEPKQQENITQVKKVNRVNIAKVEFENTNVTIIGLTPLICHAWSVKAQRMIEDKVQKKVPVKANGRAALPKEARNPEEECEAATYKTLDGKYGFPARAIKAACVEAAPLMGLNKKTVRAAFFILGDILPIIGPAPRMRTDMVRLSGIGRNPDVRYRPEFIEWEIKLPVKINASLLSAEQVFNLLNWAGSAIGIGEWRTEKNGTAGQFVVS